MDAGHPVDIVYLDFAKDFDTVPHQRLIKKLESYGIKGDVLNWIRDFLRGRKQRVNVNRVFSNWKAILSGIPQVSVFLFLTKSNCTCMVL